MHEEAISTSSSPALYTDEKLSSRISMAYPTYTECNPCSSPSSTSTTKSSVNSTNASNTSSFENGHDFLSSADLEEAAIWSDDVEIAFREAYNLYPSTGRTKIRGSDGRLYGRNELISKYITEKTGKRRNRKQVSSHIQVLLKKLNKENPSLISPTSNVKKVYQMSKKPRRPGKDRSVNSDLQVSKAEMEKFMPTSSATAALEALSHVCLISAANDLPHQINGQIKNGQNEPNVNHLATHHYHRPTITAGHSNDKIASIIADVTSTKSKVSSSLQIMEEAIDNTLIDPPLIYLRHVSLDLSSSSHHSIFQDKSCRLMCILESEKVLSLQIHTDVLSFGEKMFEYGQKCEAISENGRFFYLIQHTWMEDFLWQFNRECESLENKPFKQVLAKNLGMTMTVRLLSKAVRQANMMDDTLTVGPTKNATHASPIFSQPDEDMTDVKMTDHSPTTDNVQQQSLTASSAEDNDPIIMRAIFGFKFPSINYLSDSHPPILSFTSTNLSLAPSSLRESTSNVHPLYTTHDTPMSISIAQTSPSLDQLSTKSTSLEDKDSQAKKEMIFNGHVNDAKKNPLTSYLPTSNDSSYPQYNAKTFTCSNIIKNLSERSLHFDTSSTPSSTCEQYEKALKWFKTKHFQPLYAEYPSAQLPSSNHHDPDNASSSSLQPSQKLVKHGGMVGVCHTQMINPAIAL